MIMPFRLTTPECYRTCSSSNNTYIYVDRQDRFSRWSIRVAKRVSVVASAKLFAMPGLSVTHSRDRRIDKITLDSALYWIAPLSKADKSFV